MILFTKNGVTPYWDSNSGYQIQVTKSAMEAINNCVKIRKQKTTICELSVLLPWIYTCMFDVYVDPDKWGFDEKGEYRQLYEYKYIRIEL